jgi:hypothetical protein
MFSRAMRIADDRVNDLAACICRKQPKHIDDDADRSGLA